MFNHPIQIMDSIVPLAMFDANTETLDKLPKVLRLSQSESFETFTKG